MIEHRHRPAIDKNSSTTERDYEKQLRLRPKNVRNIIKRSAQRNNSKANEFHRFDEKLIERVREEVRTELDGEEQSSEELFIVVQSVPWSVNKSNNS